ncbi:low affinity iron permease family protein [bacterium]|nr:low affinity iron permease family protein [bacterium]
MTEETDKETENQETQVSAEVEQLMADNAAMKAKMDELLTEAKKAKQAKRDIESETQSERERIAKEKGDYEQLHKSSQERYESTVAELESLRGTIAQEKKGNVAMKLAAEIADGANAELLSEFIGRRLKFHDDGVKVTDNSGNLTVSSLSDLKTEFQNDARYSALLKGNQSSGGGASGGSNSSGATKVRNRAEFEALNPAKRMEFIKSGGTITND